MDDMNQSRSLDPRLIAGLASLSLLHPILAVLGNLLRDAPAVAGPGAGLLTLIVGIVWVVLVWLTRTARPLATLVLTGALSGLLNAVVVVTIQTTMSGESGLLRFPIGIVALIAMHTVGGLVCGLIAWGLQSLNRTPQP